MHKLNHKQLFRCSVSIIDKSSQWHRYGQKKLRGAETAMTWYRVGNNISLFGPNTEMGNIATDSVPRHCRFGTTQFFLCPYRYH